MTTHPHYPKCRICLTPVDPEHPDAIHGRNPLTFRHAWLHGFCARDTYDELAYQPARNPIQYENRQDEYNQLD